MIFGESKCAFLAINKGKTVESHEVIVMNGVAIKSLKDGDSYKYLGQDENIGYLGPLNKGRVTAEYKNVYERFRQANFLLIINTLHMFLHYQS